MQDTPYNGVATEEGAKLTVAPALCAGQEDTPYNGVATEEGAKAPCSPGAVSRAGKTRRTAAWLQKTKMCESAL